MSTTLRKSDQLVIGYGYVTALDDYSRLANSEIGPGAGRRYWPRSIGG